MLSALREVSMYRSLSIAGMAFTLTIGGLARAEDPPKPVSLLCDRLLDGRSDRVQTNVLVVIEGGTISRIGPSTLDPGADTIRLSAHTCLPGLIDTHTHI